MGLGLGIVISSLTTKYKDLTCIDKFWRTTAYVCDASALSFGLFTK